jgi:hypothetical protein
MRHERHTRYTEGSPLQGDSLNLEHIKVGAYCPLERERRFPATSILSFDPDLV